MIVFYKCSKCGDIADLHSPELKHSQTHPHEYFWNGKPNCGGYYTVESNQQEWEQQENRPYPQHLLDKYNS